MCGAFSFFNIDARVALQSSLMFVHSVTLCLASWYVLMASMSALDAL